MVKDGVFKVLNHLSKVKHVEVQQDMARLSASLSSNPENQVTQSVHCTDPIMCHL
jgi:hypothetical protein